MIATSLVPFDQSAFALPWAPGADPARRYISCLRSHGSQPTQESALRTIAKLIAGGPIDPGMVPWHRLSVTASDALAVRIFESYSTRTGNRLLAAIRGVLKVCLAERWFVVPDGTAQRDHYDALVSRLGNRRVHAKKHGRLLSDAEITMLFASCAADSEDGLRDAAILALGLGAGLRRSEIAKLCVVDIDLQTGRVAVHAGKGDKDRATFLPPAALAHVAQLAHGRASAESLIGLSAKNIWGALRERAIAAGVDHFEPHDLRRTFITRQLRAKTTVGSVQAAAGHASLATTAGYDLRGEDDVRDEIRRVDLPGAPSSTAPSAREVARRICKHVLEANARLDHGDVITKGMIAFVMKEMESK